MNLIYLIILQFSMIATTPSNYNDYRQVLIFGKSQHHTMVEQQLKLLNKDSIALKERDIQIIVVEKESLFWKQYKVSPLTFTVLLIGKDRSEKYRTDQIFQTADLFGMIDAMPMRKSEMRKKN